MAEQYLVSDAIDQARRLGLSIAVAESLTGGLLASRIVEVPGASDVFVGGVVSYHADLKSSLLDVDTEVLDLGGAVQELVAKQMARGVRRLCVTRISGELEARPADIALSTTGVAGPAADPDTGQPPGTVWIAVSSSRGERAEQFLFSGNRQEIRDACVEQALRMLVDELISLA